MCCNYDERCDVWLRTWQSSRKTYRCVECSGDIVPRERYLKIKSLYDGMWSVDRMCAHCGEAVERGHKLGALILTGGNEPFLSECIDDGPCWSTTDGSSGQLVYVSTARQLEEFGAMAGLLFRLREIASDVHARRIGLVS